MADITKLDAAEYIAFMMKMVNQEKGVSVEEMATWSIERLQSEYQPYSGQAVDAMPAMTLLLASVLTVGGAHVIGGMFAGACVGLKAADVPLTVQWAIRALELAGVYTGVTFVKDLVEGGVEAGVGESDFDASGSVNDVATWVQKLVDQANVEDAMSPVERAERQFEYESKLAELRTARTMRTEVPIDLNADMKVDAKDFGIAAKYGGFEAAASAIGVEKESEKALDIPGQIGGGECPVIGDEGYADFVQSGGAPLKTGSVSGYPKPVGEGGENVSFYNRRFGFGGSRWMTVPPGTPGAIPSRFQPGRWIVRRY